MDRKNDDLRRRIAAAGLKYWQVAEAIGVSPETLCRWLRQELTGERQRRVQNAVEALTRKKLESLKGAAK